jgi:hypothetical protein
MVNIFNDLTIPNYFLDSISINITHDLFDYLYDNLHIQDTLTRGLKTELTNNANGKYI